MKKIACISAGVVGHSFALRFAMGGYEVWAQDRSDELISLAQTRISDSLNLLVKYGAVSEKEVPVILSRIHLTTSIEEAVKDAFFIQESGPERYDIKQSLVRNIEEYALPDAVISSSTSGLLATEIAKYAEHPERIIGGHPYNPPHMIPLVEIAKGEKTNDKSVEIAKEFYASVRMEPIVLQKEALGFISNRLQYALYREAIALVMNGVCSVEDVDKALTFGPGLRWAIMGPNLVWELNGGATGAAGLLKHLYDSINLWYADMADWKKMPEEWPDMAEEGVKEEMSHRAPEIGNTPETLAAYRDKMLVEILKLHNKF